ncbi:MAG: CD3072 family TudS-related putative desulfidase [Cellulosilyticaceae bacterium]
MKKVLVVSHCVLNTASKVYNTKKTSLEEDLKRKEFMHWIIDNDVQLLQLPCPEFTLYGSSRWGHTKEQFDNPFFREHCEKILKPIITQLKEYMRSNEFDVLGVLGINGSPSCGVSYTCSNAAWGGEFSSNERISEVIKTVNCKNTMGVFMDEFYRILNAEGLTLAFAGLDRSDMSPAYHLLKTGSV